MNRYRSARRTASGSAAGPIVAFLLIACFGLLFITGCSFGGESMEETEEDTFTAEDLARFQEAGMASSTPLGMTGASMSVSSAAVLPLAGTGTVVTPAAIDPAIRKKYDALRTGSSGKGSVYRVINPFLNVRAQPNVSAGLLTSLNQGELVDVAEFVNGSWAKINLSGGKTGYVTSRYIARMTTEEKLREEQKAFEGLSFVDFTFVNVRKEPNTGSDKIGEIPGQAFVRPLSVESGWARVTLQDKQGYVSMEYLSPFRPNFLVRQEKYQVPILHYAVGSNLSLAFLGEHVARLKQEGVKFLTMRDLFELVQTQEARDVRLPPKALILAISGMTAQNIRTVSDVLTTAHVPATLFVQTDQVGLSGISEKMLLTLQANGFDLQSAGHTGDDLRTLTDAQTQLELEQSRTLLEQMTRTTVFAIAYPNGGANDRVLSQAADAGYLFGLGSAPEKTFSREQFLRLPSYGITTGMTAEDVLTLTK